jgi:long-chain fatty acid transport protein
MTFTEFGRKTMASRNLIASAVLLAIGLIPAAAVAGGFAVSEAGSRASGRAGAAAALYDDPSAVFFNPANVSRAEGVSLNLGGTALIPRWKYQAAGSDTVEQTEPGIGPPPNFSATWQLGDVGLGDLGVGLGVYLPYGSGFAWKDDWSGAESLQEISLTFAEISPVLALRPHKMFAVGAGLRYLPGSVYLRQAVYFGDQQQGDVELAGSGTGLGASAGLSLFPTDALSLAFTWRSPVTVQLDGVSNFRFPAPFDTRADDRDVRTEVPLPEVFRVGFAWDVLSDLNLSADLEYQMWSAFKEMSITFINADGSETTGASPRNAQNSYVLHLGGEYKLSPTIAVRAGYAWDQRILPEETVNPGPPESDRHVATVGASYSTGRFGLHAHFANVFFVPRETRTNDLPGTWTGGFPGGTMAYTFGLTASLNLDVAAPFGRAHP